MVHRISTYPQSTYTCLLIQSCIYASSESPIRLFAAIILLQWKPLSLMEFHIYICNDKLLKKKAPNCGVFSLEVLLTRLRFCLVFFVLIPRLCVCWIWCTWATNSSRYGQHRAANAEMKSR